MALPENEQIRVMAYSVPSSVDSVTTSTFDVEYELGKKELVSSGSDACGTLFNTNGWLVHVNVHVEPVGGGDIFEANTEHCVQSADSVGQEHSIELDTPDVAGEYEVITTFEMGGSGSSIGSVRQVMKVTAQEAGLELKDGRIRFENIVVPNTPMLPDRSFEFGVVSSNGASVIVNDPDGCSQPETPCEGTVDGYCMRTTGAIEGTEQTFDTTYCLNLPFTGTGRKYETEVLVGQTPDEEGDYHVEAYIETTASDERTGTLDVPITVTENAPEPDEGSRYRLSDDQKNEDGGLPDFERIATLGVVAVGLYAVAKIAGAAGEFADR